MDNLTKEQRRKNMQNIRSKNTTPERIIFKALRKRKIYFTKHFDYLIGKPDIAFKRKKIAVFIDSDFWHGNPEKFIMPKTNTPYWEAKIKRNQERDLYVCESLSDKGWKVLRFWESQVKKDLENVIKTILEAIGREETL